MMLSSPHGASVSLRHKSHAIESTTPDGHCGCHSSHLATCRAAVPLRAATGVGYKVHMLCVEGFSVAPSVSKSTAEVRLCIVFV